MAEKTPKSEVDYGPGHKDEHCGATGDFGKAGSCWKFQPPHSCLKIAGHIDPDSWCKRWQSARAKNRYKGAT
jgi:hypothetical protein